MENIDLLLNNFFYQFCAICKWIFAIKCAANMIRNAGASDVIGSIKELFTTAVSYACLYAIITILDSVKNSF